MSTRDNISGSREKATRGICTILSEKTPNTHTITQAREMIRPTAVQPGCSYTTVYVEGPPWLCPSSSLRSEPLRDGQTIHIRCLQG